VGAESKKNARILPSLLRIMNNMLIFAPDLPLKWVLIARKRFFEQNFKIFSSKICRNKILYLPLQTKTEDLPM